ncbi:MAG: oligoendopeptidase F [Candidatus Zixiibacteriota bacterium]
MTFNNRITSILIFTLFLLIAGIGTASAQVEQAKTRDQIEAKYKWNLDDFFPSDAAWEETYKYLEGFIPGVESYRGKLGESPQTIVECLKMSDSISSTAHRLYVYANLKYDEDQRVSAYQEMSTRVRMLYSQVGQSTSYIEPEILEIPNETLQSFLNSGSLGIYKFYIEDLLRKKAHILSAEQEEILALSGPVASSPSKIFQMVDNADIKFPNVKDEDGNEIELTRGRYSRLLESKNREVRREVSEAYNSAYQGYVNTLGATLAASVNGDIFYTKARGYNSCLENSLDGNNIPTGVFHSLIETVNNNLQPLHKYTTVRKKALGVDTLFGFDMYVPLVEDVKLEYTYDEAIKMVKEALQPLGKEYQKGLDKILNSRWVDVYETPGKETGAYSWGTYSVHPIMLLNFSGSLNDVFTLAHELGHAMNSYYTYQNEPYQYAGHSLFCAEVASTVNEALMVKYMMKRVQTREEKLYLVNHYIDQIMGTFYTQTWFSEFERDIHDVVEKGGALSSDSMRKMYRELYEKYYGPDYFIPEGRDLGCLRIGHFYRQFYVYQYATGYAAAELIAKKIMEGQPGATEAYLTFLKTGSSDYPINILKKAGVDMTTTEPYENVINTFGKLVDQYESLLFQ